jgi:protein-tyrosine-phosphatase
MKFLFVCRGNVGRSQMISALFTKYCELKSDSAGIKVNESENQKLKDIPLAEPVIRFMKREGIDVSENARKQLNSDMIKKYDKIIVIAPEEENLPEYLTKAKKVEFWDIKDPKGMDDSGYEKIISQIKERLKKFANENRIKSCNFNRN